MYVHVCMYVCTLRLQDQYVRSECSMYILYYMYMLYAMYIYICTYIRTESMYE